MPKLANVHRQTYTESAEVLNFRQYRADYDYSRYNSKTDRYGTLREANRPRRKKTKKRYGIKDKQSKRRTVSMYYK